MEQYTGHEQADDNLEIRVDDHVTLRLITQGAASEVYRLIRDNLSYLEPWVGWATEAFDEAANRRFIQDNIDAYHEGTAYAMGVYDDGALQGVVDIRNLDTPKATPEVGYWLAEKAQGKGLATRSVQALIDFSRAHHDINTIVLHTLPGNEASGRVAERLGFMYEGEVTDENGVREERYSLTEK